jgi:hypothetical protein
LKIFVGQTDSRPRAIGICPNESPELIPIFGTLVRKMESPTPAGLNVKDWYGIETESNLNGAHIWRLIHAVAQLLPGKAVVCRDVQTARTAVWVTSRDKGKFFIGPLVNGIEE